MKVKSFLLTFITVCILQNLVFSQVKLNDTIQEIIITGSKHLLNLKEIPANVSVINSEEIESTPALQIDDVLKFSPGIIVRRNAGIYSQRPVIVIRGMSGDEQSRTQVLVDGIPINTSDEGGVNWNRINLNNIDKIQVFKGPGAPFYGFNSLGGAINLITKEPEKSKEIYGGISYGTFNTIREDFMLGIDNKKMLYTSISQYYLKSDGYIRTPENKRTGYDTKQSLEELGISVKTGFHKYKWFNFELGFDIFRDKRGLGYQIYIPEGNYKSFNTNIFRVTQKGGNGITNYNLNIFYQLEHYYSVTEKIGNNGYSRFDASSYRRDMGVFCDVEHRFSHFNKIQFGLDVKKGSIDGGDYYQTQPYDSVLNDGTIQKYSCFVQYEQQFLNNKINLITALRYDYSTFSNGNYYTTTPWNSVILPKNNTWSDFSPKLGMRFNLIKKISYYVSYSHGFRTSILDDLTRTGYIWVGPKYSNPDLSPETMNNFEFGFDFFINDKAKLSATSYYAICNGFMYYVATTDSIFNRPIYKRENINSVIAKGIETYFEYEIFNGLKTTIAYTYNDSRIKTFKLNPELENKYLNYVPMHLYSISMFWKTKIINISVRSLYKGMQYADELNTVKLSSYFTSDIQLSKTIKNNYHISIDIQDLFDNRFIERSDFISPGRTITMKLAFNF